MARRWQELVQEDLNVGTANVWIHAPAGGELYSTQVGLHSFARGQKAYTTTWAPGSIATTASASTTIAVPDAAVGDLVMASHDKVLTSDLRILGNVSAAGTAQVVIHNPTGAAITVASGTLSVLVFPVKSVSVTPSTIVQGTVTFDDGGGVDPCEGNTVELRDGSDVVQATTTTNAAGFYQFVDPVVTMLDGEGFKIYVYSPGTCVGCVDTFDDSHLWAVNVTTTVDIVMSGA